jgi:hypothetical protein
MVIGHHFLAHLQALFNGPGKISEPRKKVGLGVKPEPKKIVNFTD